MFKGIREFFSSLGDTFNLSSEVVEQEETVIEYSQPSSGSIETDESKAYEKSKLTKEDTQESNMTLGNIMRSLPVVQEEVNMMLGKIISPLPHDDRLIPIIQQYFKDFFTHHYTEILMYQDLVLSESWQWRDIVVSQTARETIQDMMERHLSSLEYGVFKASLLVESRLEEIKEEEEQEKEFLAKEMRKKQEDFIENILNNC